MATRLGEIVRDWRGRRGLSLGGLAQKAGVNKSTLSRWESGAQQPRLPELEAVLEALRVPPDQRPEAFVLLQAPRALNHLRRTAPPQNASDAVHQSPPSDGVGAPPTGGDLLRAMRLRNGWTQAQTAETIGVRQASVARWERSEEWPDTERLARLCETLNAHPAETAALTQGRFSLGSDDYGMSVLDAAVLRYGNFLFNWSRGDALLDLTFLSLEAQLWPIVAHSDKASALLAEIAARHAHLLMEAGRFTEVRQCLERVPALRHSGKRIGEAQHVAIIVQAETVARLSKGTRGSRSSVRLLEDWVGSAPYDPRCTPWALSVMAELMMGAGDAEAALRTARRACHLVEQENDPREIAYRRRDLVTLLLRAGQPERAAALMQEVLPVSLRCAIVNAALWAEILLALEERVAAQSHLNEASRLLEARRLAHLRPRLEPIQERLIQV